MPTEHHVQNAFRARRSAVMANSCPRHDHLPLNKQELGIWVYRNRMRESRRVATKSSPDLELGWSFRKWCKTPTLRAIKIDFYMVQCTPHGQPALSRVGEKTRIKCDNLIAAAAKNQLRLRYRPPGEKMDMCNVFPQAVSSLKVNMLTNSMESI